MWRVAVSLAFPVTCLTGVFGYLSLRSQNWFLLLNMYKYHHTILTNLTAVSLYTQIYFPELTKRFKKSCIIILFFLNQETFTHFISIMFLFRFLFDIYYKIVTKYWILQRPLRRNARSTVHCRETCAGRVHELLSDWSTADWSHITRGIALYRSSGVRVERAYGFLWLWRCHVAALANQRVEFAERFRGVPNQRWR